MRSYRTLGAWQCAHRLAVVTLLAADRAYHPARAPLLAQLRRAAISVEANIVEGYALGTAGLFRRHLRIALGSAAEVECLLNLAIETRYLTAEAGEELLQAVDATIRTLFGLVRSRRLQVR
jgi:four helix bundle protein